MSRIMQSPVAQAAIVVLSAAALPVCQAQTSFLIKDIQFTGLQRITSSTAMSYLPKCVGLEFTSTLSNDIIRHMYDTEFFDDVTLSHRGSTLIIHVNERPVISSVDVVGNKKVSKEQLNENLKLKGISAGRAYKTEVLSLIRHELLRQYNAAGLYNAEIDIQLKPSKNNRVGIEIHITEGPVARIRSIQFTGNKAVSKSVLLDMLPMSTNNIVNWFTGKDQYTSAKLQIALKTLEGYYHSKGYVQFKVKSVQTSVSPNKHDIYLTFNLEEGERYRFSGYDVQGKTILPMSAFKDLILVKNKAIFNNDDIQASMDNISKALANLGYGMPSININPEIDDDKKTVMVHFFVNAGNRIYVRRISFEGNTKTADFVLRRSLNQREGAIMIGDNIKESERRLNNLGYMKSVDLKTKPVLGTNDQVDLLYHIEEGHSAEAMASVSYSRAYGLHFSASYNQHNFRGTGNTVGLNFTHTRFGENYSANYFDPFYTPSGIGRGYSVFYQHHTTSDSEIATYDMNRFGTNVVYSIPLTDFSAGNIGFGYQNMYLKIGYAPPEPYQAFVDNNHRYFNELTNTYSLNFSNLDRMPFPTEGFNASSGVMFSVGDINYYKLSYMAQGFYPLPFGFIATGRVQAAYGNGLDSTEQWPFFENYYAGGLTDLAPIRGYIPNTVGPRDPQNLSRAIGGNAVLSGTASMILPYPLSQASFRSALFVDAGNVFQNNLPDNYLGTPSGPLRFSYGIAFNWQSPFGPLQFSLATPFKTRPEDMTEVFQFSISGGM